MDRYYIKIRVKEKFFPSVIQRRLSFFTKFTSSASEVRKRNLVGSWGFIGILKIRKLYWANLEYFLKLRLEEKIAFWMHQKSA